MSWVEFCQSGQFDHDQLLAVQKVASRVVARRRPHVFGLGWAPEAPHVRLTMGFLSHETITDRLTALCEKATDDASFDRLLHTALDRFLIDQHRKTDAGYAARRIKNLFSDDSRFVELEDIGRWAIPATAGQMWNGDEGPLLAIAGCFTFTPVEYASDQQAHL